MQKHGGMVAGGIWSLSHEPQMRTWVIGPVEVHRKSSARAFGSVALTSRPFWLVSGICSHLFVSPVGGVVWGGLNGHRASLPWPPGQARRSLLLYMSATMYTWS